MQHCCNVRCVRCVSTQQERKLIHARICACILIVRVLVRLCVHVSAHARVFGVEHEMLIPVPTRKICSRCDSSILIHLHAS